MKRIALVAFLVASLFGLGAGAASPAWADPGDGPPPRAKKAFSRWHRQEHRRMHRHRAMRLLRRLDVTQEQKDLFKSLRQETAAARRDLATKVREIVAAARRGERTPEARKAAREQVKAAVLAAAEGVKPQVDRLLASLTPEQRQKIADAAARRGKDAETATRRLATALLLGPRRALRR